MNRAHGILAMSVAVGFGLSAACADGLGDALKATDVLVDWLSMDYGF